MSTAYDSVEVEPVLVRNFAPALASFVHGYDAVEALARRISQQVCFLQLTPTQPRRRPFALQGSDRNSSLAGNSRHYCSSRYNGAEQQEECCHC